MHTHTVTVNELDREGNLVFASIAEFSHELGLLKFKTVNRIAH